MIFVTTGTQEPFDRLVNLVKQIIPIYNGEIIIQARTQIEFHEENVKVFDFLKPEDFNRYFNSATLLISHAGMGGIISALYRGKPMVVFPRRLSLKEHRNDHQMATAKKMKENGYVYVAMEDNDFVETIKNLLAKDIVPVLHSVGAYASEELLSSLSTFIGKVK